MAFLMMRGPYMRHASLGLSLSPRPFSILAAGSVLPPASLPSTQVPRLTPSPMLLSLRKFSQSAILGVRNTYYGSSNRWSGSGGRPGRSQGFFNQFRRRLDAIPPNAIFYGILGINGAVFGLWWYATESLKNFRDSSLYVWMHKNFTTSTRNLAEGRFWTLLTSCFSHEDPTHVLMNLLTFWFMARPALGLLGNAGFLGLYLGGGLISSFISTAYSSYVGRSTGSHGASGAISAVLAFYATMFPQSTFLLFMVVPVPAWLCVSGLALYDLYGSLTNPRRRVDGAGHLGGFLGGFLYALRLRARLI